MVYAHYGLINSQYKFHSLGWPKKLECKSIAFHTWPPASKTASNEASNLRWSQFHASSLTYRIMWCGSNISDGPGLSRNSLSSQPHKSKGAHHESNYTSPSIFHRLQKRVVHMEDRPQCFVKPGEFRASGSISPMTMYSFETYKRGWVNLKLSFWVNV